MTELADVAPTTEGPSIRDAVIASVGAHRESPDISSAVNGALVDRNREIRTRDQGGSKQLDHYEHQARSKDHLHSTIRNAVADASRKAAQATTAPLPSKDAQPVHVGPPPSLSLKDQQEWGSWPEAARIAFLDQHSQFKPHLEKYSEIDRVMAPHREAYQRHGIKSDAEAMAPLLKWREQLENPATRLESFGRLMAQYGVTPDMLGGSPQQYQQPQHSPQEVANVERQVSSFSEGRQHFGKVREIMGLLLDRHGSRYMAANGAVNLDALYRAACKLEGLTPDRPLPPAPPRPRAPVGRVDPLQPRNTGIGDALRAAFRANR